MKASWISSSSAIFPSSRTSITASRRWPTASSSSPARSRPARWKRRCSTRWTSSASAASRSRRTRSGCTTRREDGKQYVLNLIDTPGHVDFSYEVTRSLAACEGALLLVDASQGVEAQTLANAYLAVENNLEIIPVINKIDLPGAQPEEARRQIEEIIGLDGRPRDPRERQGRASAPKRSSRRSSRGCRRPKGTADAPLKALIFDSWYDPYRGVVIVVRVIDGVIRPGMKIRLMATGAGISGRAGRRVPARSRWSSTSSASARSGSSSRTSRRSSDAKIGDTVTEAARPALRAVSRLQGTASRWSSRASIRSKATSTRSCATRSRSCG